jgi:hypothetical protein
MSRAWRCWRSGAAYEPYETGAGAADILLTRLEGGPGVTTRFVQSRTPGRVAADVVLSRHDLSTAKEFRLKVRGKSATKEVRCSLSPM